MTTQPVCFDQPQALVRDDARRASTAPSGKAHLAETWGVEVVALRLSAGGYMVDCRYRVTDAEKAKPFLDGHAKPKLISQKTGAVMYVPSSPKVGPMRQTPRSPDPSRIYFILFANPGRHIKAGDKVAVAVGDCKIENLVVH